MGVSEATQLKMAFVGGIDAGTTSLIRTITKGYSPEASQPPHTKYVYFDPSSYQPASHRVIETTETKTGRPKHGKWLAEKRRAFWLTFEDFDARGVLRYTDAAVVALCFSVAARESFNMIRTKWYPEIRHFAPHAQLVIVGTMVDLRPLPHAPTGQSTAVATSDSHATVSHYEGNKLAMELHASYVECPPWYYSEGVDDVWKTMLWRWHEFGEQKESPKGASECILQ